MEIVLVVLVGAVMAVGVVGTLVPVLPGLPIVWLAGLVYGLLNGFGTLGIAVLAVMALLAVAGEAASYVLAGRRGRSSNVPRSSLIAGAVGAVLGFFLVPVVGLPVGGATGVLVAERSRLGTWDRAWATTRSVLIGFGQGVLVEFAAGLAMVLAWAIWVVMG